jgi:hypothetical protein
MTTNRQFSLALEALASLKVGGNSSEQDRSQPVPAAPALERVLSEIGQLPREALFLGIASDGLPVLLNLHNPAPGPLLVIGDAGSGKTAFLQSIARSLALTHTESDLQYGVITGRTAEWAESSRTGHQVGVFDVNQSGAQDFIVSLSSWAHSNRESTQTVLLLIDDLESVAKMDRDALQNFRWLLLRGPARRVWPILTMNAERYGQVLTWIEIFRARVFGRISNPQVSQALSGDPASGLEKLEARVQFSMRESGNWLRFWLPSF